MKIKTIEDNFNYQAKQILQNVLKGNEEKLKECFNVEEFSNQLYLDYAESIGREFLQRLFEYDGDDTLTEVMEDIISL